MLSLITGMPSLLDGSAQFYDTNVNLGGTATPADLVLLGDAVNATGARCLDSTPAAYYIHKGTASTKWYIHHQGGGWCESWDDCLGRSGGDLGSSKGYPATSDLGSGYFSTDPAQNPMMHDWNMVFLKYCDGGSFSGSNETVGEYKGKPLYYRGKRNREAAYASLLATAGLGDATDVVISGCSAGGLATWLHTDQWCDALAKDAAGVKCVGLPDSGFFLDYQSPTIPGAAAAASRELLFAPPGRVGTTVHGNYHAGLRWVYETMNATAGVNQDCVDAHGTGGPTTDAPPYLCMFAEHTAVFTHTPIFALQSVYDSWQVGNVLAPNEDVQTLGDNITKRIKANSFGPHPASGAFLDSCYHHCGAWNGITIDGDLVSAAFSKWYDTLGQPGAKVVWNQDKPWKCDDCCKP